MTTMLRELWFRLRSTWNRTAVSDEMDAEFRFHIERATERNLARGMSPDEARTAALRTFGGVSRHKDDASDEQRSRSLEGVVDDARQATRRLMRAPLASAFIIGTLIICIGATTATFSFCYGVMVRALPFRDPEQLVWLSSVRPTRTDAPFNLPEVMDLREQSRTMDIAAYASWSASLGTTGVAERLQGMKLTGDALEILGVTPSVGRLLTNTDDAAAAPRVLMISRSLWLSRFGGSATVVGQELRIDGETYTIVGVMPEFFPLPLRDVEVFAALKPDLDPRRHIRSSTNFLRLIGRLKGGATPATAEREMSELTQGLRAQFPVEYADKIGVRATPLREYLVGDQRTLLRVLFGCVAIMLLIAFANVVNLLAIRATGRQGEIAVRRALGASTWHVARALVAEAVLQAVVAGAGGAILAYWLVGLVAARLGSSAPRVNEVRVDGVALLFVVGLSVAAMLVFSLAPLAIALRTNAQEALRAGARSQTGRGAAARLRNTLVIAEIALTMVLTTGTGALLVSLRHLEHVDLGFRPESVFVARMSLPPRYGKPQPLRYFYERLSSSLASEPGVSAAGVITIAPLSGLLAAVQFAVIGGAEVTLRDRPSANFRAISPGYLEAIRARIVRGRPFSASDDADAPHVALVSRALAERYVGNADPTGKEILIDDNNTGPRPVRIVGVVDNMRQIAIDGVPSFDIYIPWLQAHPDGTGFLAANEFWMVRVDGDPALFTPRFLQAVKAIDPDAAVARTGTLQDYVTSALATRRASVASMLGFASIAMLLATLGVYGVLAYTVEQRRREIGLRLALGATSSGTVGLILRGAATVAGIGVVIGTVGSLAAGKAMSTLLFGVSPGSPAILAAVGGVLLVASLVASAIPAWRAARIDPATVLAGS